MCYGAETGRGASRAGLPPPLRRVSLDGDLPDTHLAVPGMRESSNTETLKSNQTMTVTEEFVVTPLGTHHATVVQKMLVQLVAGISASNTGPDFLSNEQIVDAAIDQLACVFSVSADDIIDASQAVRNRKASV